MRTNTVWRRAGADRRRRLPAATALLAFALTLICRAAMAQAPAGSKTDAGGPVLKAASARAAGLVDVNHASVEELEALPGIADAYARKIVKNRPYANKTQLLSKGVLSAATYAKITPLIIAKQ